MVWRISIGQLLLFSLAHACGLDGGQDAHPDIAGCGPQAVALKQAPRAGDATGTTGTPVLMAMRKAPALNSPAPPSSPL